MGNSNSTITRLTAMWGRMTMLQRGMLVGTAVLAVVLLTFFTNAARTPEYAVAFSNLPEDEAAAIVAKLKEAKVPYQIGPGGTIKVPPGQADEVRLLMAGQGLPRKGSSVGFELFNTPQFGMTEFAEKINYQRALEGELARTISRLDTLEGARVHLVVPQPALFTKDQKEATASVVVQLKPGRRLDQTQIQGIVQMVSSSVEGLKPQNVAVLDQAGNVLSDRNGPQDPARQTGDRGAVQQALETRIENQVRQMLGQMVGPDKAIVRVSADLDWDQYESNSETFSPQQKAPQIRSQRQVSETSAGGGASGGGVPGVDSNVPTYPGGQAAAGGAQSTAERKDTTTNYELSKTVEKLVRAPGGVKRLSVAVALDSQAVQDASQADAISKLVATAAGLDVNRGDVVTLTSLPFSAAGDKGLSSAAEEAKQREFLLSILRLVAMALGPLLAIGLIWMILPRGKKQPKATKVSMAPGGQPQAVPAAEARAQLPSRRKEDEENSRIQKELIEAANSDPAAVAQLVRTWVHEDRR